MIPSLKTLEQALAVWLLTEETDLLETFVSIVGLEAFGVPFILSAGRQAGKRESVRPVCLVSLRFPRAQMPAVDSVRHSAQPPFPVRLSQDRKSRGCASIMWGRALPRAGWVSVSFCRWENGRSRAVPWLAGWLRLSVRRFRWVDLS